MRCWWLPVTTGGVLGMVLYVGVLDGILQAVHVCSSPRVGIFVRVVISVQYYHVKVYCLILASTHILK